MISTPIFNKYTHIFWLLMVGRLSCFGQFFLGILCAKYVVYMQEEGIVVRIEFVGNGVIMVSSQ